MSLDIGLGWFIVLLLGDGIGEPDRRSVLYQLGAAVAVRALDRNRPMRPLSRLSQAGRICSAYLPRLPPKLSVVGWKSLIQQPQADRGSRGCLKGASVCLTCWQASEGYRDDDNHGVRSIGINSHPFILPGTSLLRRPQRSKDRKCVTLRIPSLSLLYTPTANKIPAEVSVFSICLSY